MFKKITVANFRGFRELQLESLGRINLIVGDNNLGKTSLLEAIFLRLGHNLPDIGLRLNLFRGMTAVSKDPRETWGWLFFAKRIEGTISIATESEGGAAKEVHLRIASPDKAVIVPANGGNGPNARPPGMHDLIERRELLCEFLEGGKVIKTVKGIVEEDGSFRVEGMKIIEEARGIYLGASAISAPENAERLSALDRMNRSGALLEALRVFDPRIRRISPGIVAGQSMVYVDLGFPELLPANVAGAGIQRLLSILLAIYDAAGGVVLVDEVENGLYHTRMKDVWKAIAAAARRENVQVFVTTHSFECLRAAHQAFRENPPYELRVHRLERGADGDTVAVTLDEKNLQVAIEQNWEVR